MRSELADANRPKRRITRSRLAKPLLTSMGSITMLAASTFVLLAVASSGSAAAASAPAGSTRALQPLVSVATVPDQASSSTSDPAGASRTTSGSTSPAHTGAHSSSGSGAPQHLVVVRPGASTSDVINACVAAMTEVEDECESALQSRCPAVRMPQTQGTTAIQEMEDECAAPRSPSPNPSATPHDE